MRGGWAVLVLALSSPAPAPGLPIAPAPPPLQPLIDAAPEGSTLVPPPGRYAGPVVLAKALILDGQDAVTIDGLGHGTIVKVEAKGVTLKRLHLTGSGDGYDAIDAAVAVEADEATLAFNRVDDVLFGISMKASSHALICGNRIRSRPYEPGLRGDSVRIWEGAHNLVYGNDLYDARDVTLANTTDNRVENNRIARGRYGMQLVFAPRNRIEGNLLDGNLTGIAVLYSEDVQIRRNQVQHSTGVAGACLVFKESSQAVVEDNAVVHCATGAKTNAPTTPLAAIYFRRNLFAHNVEGINFYGENGGHVLHDNRFEHNLTQVSVSAPMSARGHDWLGNSWDDYQGFDHDGDGVGDTPYEIWSFADRIWMEEPKSTFFRNSPLMELIDFLERLAPFANPELILRDPKPVVRGLQAGPGRDWKSFEPSCPKETT